MRKTENYVSRTWMAFDDFKIIDFKKVGNVIRFYLGSPDCEDYWGDDWNDSWDDCGIVYDEYVTATIDIGFSQDYAVFCPGDTEWNTQPFTNKEMLKDKAKPCIVFRLTKDDEDPYYPNAFYDVIGYDDCVRIYYGDSLQKLLEMTNADDIVALKYKKKTDEEGKENEK